ncbi:MAG: hypothetical protein LBR93_07760 [Treponema sp.]|jgi:hypothetical protein|nr:hypothetical protein [Treponema sp.]
MKRKSLLFGLLAVLSAVLIFTGCVNPADGSDGAPGVGTEGPDGKNIGFVNTTSVTAAELKALFETALVDVVTLGTVVEKVDGEIPSGKKLIVTGPDTAVKNGESLEIKADGTLAIFGGAKLNASYTSTVGYVKGSAAGITGEGVIVLPFVDGGTLPEGGISYTADIEAKKAVGSYNDGDSTPAGPLDNAGIVKIFGLTEGPDSLTVADITGLTKAAVPSGKTLTLTGTANTFTGALDLALGGDLIVDGTLATTGTFEIKANGTDSNITINGKLDLGATGTIAGKITNNGVISSAATTNTVLMPLITTPVGSGKVVLSGDAGSPLSGTAALTQNVEIAENGTLKAAAVAAPFSNDKTITIETDGTLDLGEAVATLSLTGVTIKNDGGTIATTTTSDKALQAILNAGVGGNVTSDGAVVISTENPLTAFTVPAGTEFTHKTGAFLGGAVPIVIEGDATFTTGTFASQTGKVTVNGTATFTVGTFEGLVGAANQTIVEVGPNGNATFTAATFKASNQTVGNIVINGTASFGAAAAPGGNVTVGASGVVNIGTAGSLAVTGTKTLTVGGSANNVTFTKATVKGTLTGETGTVTIADTQTIVLVDTGTIVVAGEGKVDLVHTTFGAGTYTAGKGITITAATAGDTIVTDSVDNAATNKLAVGDQLALGEKAGASTTAATYTFKKGGDNKVVLNAAENTITIPADSGNTGAQVEVSAAAGITLGDGSILLGRATAGGAGSLKFASGATIGTFTEETNSKLATSGNFTDGDNESAKDVPVGSANDDGVITADTKTVYGAKDGTGNATIDKDTDFTA